VNGRYLLVFSALLLCADGAYGGWYQLTKDGKTRVWNDQRGLREATWSGDRDQEGFAAGEGTLTWYRVERKVASDSYLLTPRASGSFVIATYSGTMVHGKFDGSVVDVDANGNTFNGTFVKGNRVGAWVFVPAPSPSPSRTEPGRPAERTALAANQRRDEQAHRDLIAKAKALQEEPSPTPVEGPSSPRPESIRPPDRTAVASSQRREEEARRDALAEAKRASSSVEPSPIPASGQSLPRSESIQPAASTSTASSQPRQEQARRDVVVEAGPASPAEGPSPAPDEKVSQQTSAHTVKEISSPGIRDPLFSLANPPSLLGMRSAVSSRSAPTTPSSSQALQQLNEFQVVALADAEAQKHGYNLGEYQRWRPKWFAADGVWLVSYDQKYASGGGKYFSVSVEDKTKKTSLAAAR